MGPITLTYIKPESLDQLSFNQAITEGNLDLVKNLLKDPYISHKGALSTAARLGHCKVIRELILNSKSDPAEDDNTPLRLAVRYGHTEVVELLLSDRRADPTVNDSSCDCVLYGEPEESLLYRAVSRGYTKIVELLLEDDRVLPTVDFPELIALAQERGYSDIINSLKDGQKKLSE